MNKLSAFAEIRPVIILVIAGAFIFGCCFGQGREIDPDVKLAFDLRINGNADSAKVILDQMLAQDSTNAGAWFELARTKHHIGLGNPRLLFGGLEDLQQTIDRATIIDPSNVTYAFYKGDVCFLRAYVALMRDRSTAPEKVKQVISAYESVLTLKPDYYQAALFLVEALALPSDMSGDSAKAEMWAKRLEKKHAVYGAKARELLLPEEANRVEYWQNVLRNNPGNADVLEQIGKAYLSQDDTESGEKLLMDTAESASGKKLLFLDVARYYLMASRNDSLKAGSFLPKADNAIHQYLATKPIAPLEAFALIMLAQVKGGMGSEEAESFRSQAEAIDPNVSKAFGIPPLLLFDELNEISQYHSYFFRPF